MFTEGKLSEISFINPKGSASPFFSSHQTTLADSHQPTLIVVFLLPLSPKSSFSFHQIVPIAEV
ncbi:uncharacterized protein G2W53_036958 [Senna tora]|uniref:Uncharacterized protein n=1 Tax=Senna tora TaxID=362788 RepID=A0A834W5A2_9FABA|nr:uncharacterized protein G2W53_036958 [Senna tora]